MTTKQRIIEVATFAVLWIVAVGISIGVAYLYGCEHGRRQFQQMEQAK